MLLTQQVAWSQFDGGMPGAFIYKLPWESIRSHAEHVEGDSLAEMITADLLAERISIDSYRSMIASIGADDPTTRQVLEQILAQEEAHAENLAGLLSG